MGKFCKCGSGRRKNYHRCIQFRETELDLERRVFSIWRLRSVKAWRNYSFFRNRIGIEKEISFTEDFLERSVSDTSWGNRLQEAGRRGLW